MNVVFGQFFFSLVSGPKALNKYVCVLPYSIAVKSYRTFLKLKKCDIIFFFLAAMYDFVYEINISITMFLTILRRFPTTFLSFYFLFF